MKSKLAFLVSCVLSATSLAETNSGAEFLSGNWAIISETGVSSCDLPARRGEQIGFEFARSGGRAVLYEATDLFTVIGGLEVRAQDDELILTARTRSGDVKEFQRIRRKGPNEAEVVPEIKGRPPVKLQRCTTQIRPIAEGVSDANLFALTPTYSGGQGFPEVLSGEAPTDVCEGKVKSPSRPFERGTVQFELIGPSNFWAMFYVLGWEPGRKRAVLGFSTILSARQVAADTVQLSMRRWEGEGGAPTNLTVRIGVDRIEIPEIQATFARCKPDQKSSLGMGRW
jgi:hypothetical protein